MIEQEAIKHLITHRAKTFGHLSKSLGILGFSIKDLYPQLTAMLENAVNSPSFVITNPNLQETLRNSKVHNFNDYVTDTHCFKLPFDSFSVISEMPIKLLTGVQSMTQMIILVSRSECIDFYAEEYSAKDRVVVYVFTRSVGLDKNLWKLRPPIVVDSSLYLDGVIKFTMWLSAHGGEKPIDVVETLFEKNYSVGVEEYENQTAALLLAAIDRITTKGSVVSYAPMPSIGHTLATAAKNKAPLFIYKEIPLTTLKKEPRCYLGGTHASPAQHDRRGCNRTYTHPRYVNVRGQTKWIDPTVVGKLSNGRIEKDYTT